MAQVFLLPDYPICLDARGAWWHDAQLLHPRVASLFARHLVPTAAGEYFIVLGRARHVVQVADTAFFVRSQRLGLGPDGRLTAVRLHLSDGGEEDLDPSTLMQAPDGTFYCRLTRHGLAVPCRFSPAQYHELALHAEADGTRVVLPVAGSRHAIAPYRRAVLQKAAQAG